MFRLGLRGTSSRFHLWWFYWRFQFISRFCSTQGFLSTWGLRPNFNLHIVSLSRPPLCEVIGSKLACTIICLFLSHETHLYIKDGVVKPLIYRVKKCDKMNYTSEEGENVGVWESLCFNDLSLGLMTTLWHTLISGQCCPFTHPHSVSFTELPEATLLQCSISHNQCSTY